MSSPLAMLTDTSSAALFSLDPSRVCYLNAASRTPLPISTLDIGLKAVRRKAETPWDIGDTEADKDKVRALFASLLGSSATAQDIAMVPCCSYAMSLAANNFRTKMRSRAPDHRVVIVLQDQNPSNVMQWQQLCEEEGGQVKVIPYQPDGNWSRAVCAALAMGNVAVAALPPCHWCDGSLVELPPIASACRAHGTSLVLDATQWVGAGPTIDVGALGVTFLACSIHKWLLGPYGGALCYASPEFWSRAQPLEQHDRNREGAQHVECLPMSGAHGGYPMAFQEGARRLDGGGRPSFIVLPMLLESLRVLTERIGVERLQERLAAYTEELVRRSQLLGFSAPPRHAPGIVGLKPGPGLPDADAIVRFLKARKPRPVLVSERFGVIRVSPHTYNTIEDLECLISGLHDAIVAAPRAVTSRL